MANERRLIDANALHRRTWLDGTVLVMAVQELDEAPTVDAVEVVRCKDCYWNDRPGRCMNSKCGKSWYGCPVPDEHYCSYGEKREVE